MDNAYENSKIKKGKKYILYIQTYKKCSQKHLAKKLSFERLSFFLKFLENSSKKLLPNCEKNPIRLLDKEFL